MDFIPISQLMVAMTIMKKMAIDEQERNEIREAYAL